MKNNLKIVIFLLVMLGLWQLTVAAFSQEYVDNITVTVDGQRVESDGAVYFDGGVMSRLDWLAGALGAELRPEGNTFALTLGGDELVIKPRVSEALLNGERYKMDNAALKKNGEVWVHTRTVAEAFGGAAIYVGSLDEVSASELKIYTPEGLAEMQFKQRLAAAQRMQGRPPQVYFNGGEVVEALSPVLLDGSWYVQDSALLRLLAKQQEMDIEPSYTMVPLKEFLGQILPTARVEYNKETNELFIQNEDA